MDKGEPIRMKDFDLIKDLGFGSYGKVELIRRKEDSKLYALKTVQLGSAKQKEKDAALNQIRLLASIQMTYVIAYKGSFYVPETQSLCIVMEYADGGDLEKKINQRSNTCSSFGFDERFIWKTSYELLKGLKILHQNNIIHRDLKSANVFFANGVAKIGDLNISKLSDNGFCSTQTGTPYYTSPQIWKGQVYDHKCDIWSLGCIIYELCTLMPPFRAADFPGLFQAVTNGSFEDISQKYSHNLKQFIAFCLMKDPKKRLSAVQLLEKSYFADFQPDHKLFKFDQEEESCINIIQPIQCPKILRFLNDKLPKSKFEESEKKTVCFATKKEIESQPTTSFKIKTKKIKSEKVISMHPFEQEIALPEPKILTKQLKPQSKNTMKLPPLQKDVTKSKSTIRLPSGKEIKSMKSIPEKENKKVTLH